MSTYALYLFDLDGTLVNTLPVWNQLTRVFLAEFGITVSKEEIAAMDHMSYEEGIRHMREVLGVPLSAEEFPARWLATAKKLYEREATLFPYAHETLDRLRAEGSRLVLFTQSPRALVQDTLELMDLWRRFDDFIFAGERTVEKGAAQAVVDVADEYGVSLDRTAVVEDAPYAAMAAKEAGVYVYGVGIQNEKREALAQWADIVVDDLRAIR